MVDIIVIGAGTAGLSAAIYGLRAGKSVLVLEEKAYGGQIVNASVVENYPGILQISGYEFATDLYEQAAALGMNLKYETVTGLKNRKEKKIVMTAQNQYEGKSVVIATGAKNRPLGVEREDELIGSGVSYCATCDGAFFKGKEVAVVGGGNTALEDALFLTEYCRKVYIIHRRNEFRGEDKLVDKLKGKAQVEVILDSRVMKLNGREKLEAVEVIHNKTKEKKKIKVDGLFVAVGQMPANKPFEQIIAMDVHGYILASENCMTNLPGVFAAGDCRTKAVRQLTTAASDGTVAALAACEYIAGIQ